jgi:hypothetical protein
MAFQVFIGDVGRKDHSYLNLHELFANLGVLLGKQREAFAVKAEAAHMELNAEGLLSKKAHDKAFRDVELRMLEAEAY